MLKTKKNILLILFLISCSELTNQNIYKEVLADSIHRNPQILFEKKINLDDSIEDEMLYIIRNGNEEILVIYKLYDGKYKLEYKKFFSLLNIGAFKYENKKWIPSIQKQKDELFIIKKLDFIQLKGNSYNSILLEFLSEEPPFELFSIPILISNYKTIFDGLAEFKESKQLKENNRVEYFVDLQSKKLILK